LDLSRVEFKRRCYTIGRQEATRRYNLILKIMKTGFEFKTSEIAKYIKEPRHRVYYTLRKLSSHGKVEQAKLRVNFSFWTRKNHISLVSYPYISKTFLNFAKRAKREFYFISPFLTRKGLIPILKKIKKEVQVKAIVGTKRACTEVRRAANQSKRKISIKLGGKIHCKILLNDKEVIIGSCNITEAGIENSKEVGILTNDQNIVSAAKNFFHYLWTGEIRYNEPYYGNKFKLNTPTRTVFISSCQNFPFVIFDLFRQAKKKITLVTPFLTSEAIKLLMDQINENVELEAIIKIDENDWKRMICDPWAIDILLERCDRAWNDPRLHGKVIIIDDMIAVISSLNITDASFKENYEAGVLSQNSVIIDALKQFIEVNLKSKLILREEFEKKWDRFLLKQQLKKVIIQKEGDHFSDEEESSKLPRERVEIESVVYPQHIGMSLELPPPPKPLRTLKRRVKKAKPPTEEIIIIKKEVPRNDVFIGQKPIVNYVLSSLVLFQKGAEEISIKARGQLISKAVYVAEFVRKTLAPNVAIKKVEIGTEQRFDKEGRVRNVSTIELILKKYTIS